MPLPTTLYNYFNQGKANLEMSSALMNPYAKWMQSPNIPRNACLPIAIESIESAREGEPTVDEWFQQLESNTRKTQLPVPLFFPRSYQTPPNYYCTEFRGEDRFIQAILSANDPMYSMYSASLKQQAILKFIEEATNVFPRVYNAAVFRLYKEKKAQIYGALFKNASSAALHVYSIVLNKNILVLRDIGYEWCSKVIPVRETICLWEKDKEVGALIDTESKGHIDVDEIVNTKMDVYETRTKNVEIASNARLLAKNRELSKKTVAQLKEEISEVESGGGGGSEVENGLKKQDLIDSLLTQFINSSSGSASGSATGN